MVFGHIAIYLGRAHQDLCVSVLSVKLSNVPFGVCLDPTVVSSAELQVQKSKTGPTKN